MLYKNELFHLPRPTGTSILINIFGIHRDPLHYPSPHVFMPDRFAPAETPQRPRQSYIPFGSGPRKCIGQKVALLHLKLALSVLVRRFQFLPSDRYTCMEDCVTAFRFVIEFKDGCYVKVRPRDLPATCWGIMLSFLDRSIRCVQKSTGTTPTLI